MLLKAIVLYIILCPSMGTEDVSHRVHLLQDDGSTIADWLRSSERLHRTLRPALPSDYIGYLRHMFSEGARMAVLSISAEPKALAVYRIHHTTFQGLRFYLDDLVTDEQERGAGLGLFCWSGAWGRREQNGATPSHLIRVRNASMLIVFTSGKAWQLGLSASRSRFRKSDWPVIEKIEDCNDVIGSSGAVAKRT